MKDIQKINSFIQNEMAGGKSLFQIALGLDDETRITIMDCKLPEFCPYARVASWFIDFFENSGGWNYRKASWNDDEIKGDILAAAYKSETFLTRVQLGKDNILLVGDRYKIQEYAINSGIKLLLLVNNVKLPKELLDKARKNRVNVISVPLGTFKCSNMVKLCNYVKLLNRECENKE